MAPKCVECYDTGIISSFCASTGQKHFEKCSCPYTPRVSPGDYMKDGIFRIADYFRDKKEDQRRINWARTFGGKHGE